MFFPRGEFEFASRFVGGYFLELIFVGAVLVTGAALLVGAIIGIDSLGGAGISVLATSR